MVEILVLYKVDFGGYTLHHLFQFENIEKAMIFILGKDPIRVNKNQFIPRHMIFNYLYQEV